MANYSTQQFTSKPRNRYCVFGLSLTLGIYVNLWAADATNQNDLSPWLSPYNGPTRTDVDATTLDGKVLCGYQGWFNTPCDGTSFGFSHWGNRLGETNGQFVVDMWPETAEYDP